MYMILTLFFKIKTQYKYGIGETTIKKTCFYFIMEVNTIEKLLMVKFCHRMKCYGLFLFLIFKKIIMGAFIEFSS